MKEIERIDFDRFNKPKHFPEWLCDGETLKLAKLGDNKLAELDKNTLEMARQYDIDMAKGSELDRIGKILGEERNGNNDEVYRMYLKLRTMLNNADGTVEDIIKFCKFFFSGEVVHVVPNYPAGIRLLHDGSNDVINFNLIIRQIVGAGISYDTRELFNMKDEMPFEDIDEKKVSRSDKNYFARSSVFRNGRVLHDGRTVLDTELEILSHDGFAARNGSIARRDGKRIISAKESIGVPIFRRSGIVDLLVIEQRDVFKEMWRSNLLRNGVIVRDKSEHRCGYAESSITDTLSVDTARQSATDELHIFDIDSKTVVPQLFDTIGHDYRRDGKLTHYGNVYRSSDAITDSLAMHGATAVMSDEWVLSDLLKTGIRHHYYRDGSSFRNGSNERKGDVLISA